MLFPRIIKRTFSLFSGGKTSGYGKNVSIGENTDMIGKIDQSRAPNSKITIGRDCMFCGNISLEMDNAVVVIGDNVFIGPGTSIVCTNKIEIESDILISADCLIQDSDNHSLDFEIRKKDVADWKRGYHDWTKHPSIPIRICRGAWVGAKVIILKGVTIGEKSIIGAGSVIAKNVESGIIVAGNPAKIIREL